MKINILILISFSVNVCLIAQKLIHKNYSTDHGLINGQIETIYEDSKGIMWFGTYGGASKWDGKSFTNYQLTNGLGANQVFDFEEDDDGKIFFATYGAGISILDNNKIYNLNDSINFQSIWISSLYKNSKKIIYFGGIDGEIYEFKNNKVEIPYFKELIPKNSIWDIYESSDGSLYLATYGGGLVKINDKHVKVYTTKDGLLNNAVWSVKEDKSGNIWIATSGGISVLKNNKFVNFTTADGLPGTKVYSLTVDKNNVVYAATDQGGARISMNNIFPITENNGLILSETWEVFTDSRGIVYFGTGGEGFSCLFPNDIVSFNEDYGASANNFHCFLIDQSGSLLVGTENGIFIFSQNNFNKYITPSQLKYSRVNSMVYGINNELYIATNSGIAIKKQNSFKWIDTNDGLPDNDILLIKRDNRGNIYAATRKGTAVIANEKIKTLLVKDGLRENYTRALYCVSEDEVYFGSFGKGVAIFIDGKWDSLTTYHGLPDEHINTIHKSTDGILFVGTYNGGLFIYAGNDSFKIIQEKDGLLSNTIISLTEDKFGNIYVGTFKGISIFNPKDELLRIKNITKYDGLPNNQGYRDAIIFDKENNLWYGTVSGAAKIPYERLYQTFPPPIVSLSKMSIFENQIDLNDFLLDPILAYDENYLKLEFSGVEYFSPEQIVFSYQLLGVDTSWVNTERNFVQYTNLKYGDYNFNLKAMNASGIWSDLYTMSFTIKPALWQTWWFLLLIIVVILSISSLLIYLKVKQILAVENFRRKISADLHDNIGSGLSEISIMSEVLKYKFEKIQNSEIENLDKISDTARRLVSSMSEVVWLTNPRNDSLKDIFSRLLTNFQPVCTNLGIQLNSKGLDLIQDVYFSLNQKQNIFLFVKEAINNAIKYSKCSRIEIIVSRDKNRIEISVFDNGIGIDTSIQSKGFGLENMEMRSKELSGKFELISDLNKGTTVKLILQINKIANYIKKFYGNKNSNS